MATRIESAYPIFNDVDGSPLEDGFIYIGVYGFNALTNPIATFWDTNLSVPAPQPIRTIGGYPSKGGSPGALYTADNSYSIVVQDKNSRLVYANLVVSGSNLNVVSVLANLRQIVGSYDGQEVATAGYYTVGDKGRGTYYWDRNSTASDDGGSVILPTGYTGSGRWILMPEGGIYYSMQFGAYGNGVTDDEQALNAGLAAAVGATFVVNNPESFYLVTDDLNVPSNVVVILEPGVIIQTGAGYFGTGEAILRIEEQDSVTIIGNNAKVVGLREGSGSSIISMGVSILGSTNVVVQDLLSEDASGDGFYVAGASDNTPLYSTNVFLIRCRADNCMRQGLSIVGAKNMWVVDCIFENTNGKTPSAGIDIEPDPTGTLDNINIIDTVATANEGAGYQVELNSIQADIDITFQSCKAFGGRSGANATGFRVSDSKYDYAQGAGVKIYDCEANGTYSFGLLLYNLSNAAAQVTVKRFRSIDSNTAQIDSVSGATYQNTPMGIFAINNVAYATPGNVYIEDIEIIDGIADRSPYAIQSSGTAWDNVIIKGIRWESSVGTTTIPYTNDAITNCLFEWADGPFKWNRITDITLTARYNGFLFHNTGDTNGVVYTLPAIAAGLSYTFECVAAQALRIDSNASDRLWPYASGDGKYMETSTPGSTALVYANADASDWVVQRFGTWTDE